LTKRDRETEWEEIKQSPGYPSDLRIQQGPVAVIECAQYIPCDVCGAVCPYDAIQVDTVCALPELRENRCIGCRSCIPVCPGLAIFVIDSTYSKDEALISFPYELLPIPQQGDLVDATDREGSPLVKGTVITVEEHASYDHTHIVTIAVPKHCIHHIRGITLPSRRTE
jgi:Fe-S-cluster-containing hydrogenase component 2